MKVIITGATGQIGAQALNAAIHDPAVTHIFTLTRRPLPASISSPKLTAIVHTDFKSYPETLLSQLSGAEACIASIGTTPRKGDGSLESYTTTDVDCTLAAAKAFLGSLGPQLGGKKFRFVYVSAFGAERDTSKLKSLWFAPGPRISKGMTENALAELQKENLSTLEVYYARLGLTFRQGNILPTSLLWGVHVNRDDQVGAALVDIAKNGFKNEIVTSRELTELGEKALLAKE